MNKSRRSPRMKVTAGAAVVAVVLAGTTGTVLAAPPSRKSVRQVTIPAHNSNPRVATRAVAHAKPQTGLSLSSGKASSRQTISAHSTRLDLLDDHGQSRGWQALGEGGIRVIATSRHTAASSSRMAPTTAEVLAPTAALKISGTYLAMRLTPGTRSTAQPLQLSVPDKYLDGLYGADYHARIRWQVIDAAGHAVSAKTSHPRGAADTRVSVPASARPMTVAAVSGATASDGSGSFAATTLSPSGSWDASQQTGSFTYSYPLRLPPAPGGDTPQLALVYDSGSVDGETGGTNNQPSAFGDGWSLSGAGGFIERAYDSCVDDGQTTNTGDRCWNSDNARVSIAGHSGRLVHTSGNNWTLQDDDGTVFTHGTGASNGDNDGEQWAMHTPDGTVYYFGRSTNSAWNVPVYGDDTGEPCHASTFAASSCVQTWRWNLDWIQDPNGNVTSFQYTVENNRYLQNKTTSVAYTRGGQLTTINYGGRAGTSNPGSGQVAFDLTDRCSPDPKPSTPTPCDSAHPSRWPDVPWDQNCTATCTSSQTTPTFWTQYRISGVHARVYSGTGTTFTPVDDYGLGYTFPDPGDGSPLELWLQRILHVGSPGSGQIVLPYTTFGGNTYDNRITPSQAGDALTQLPRYRITAVQNETGGATTVSYSAPECSSTFLPTSAQGNTKRCFPQYYGSASKVDWFHKYAVTSVTASPRTGSNDTDLPVTTQYDYGTPGWRYETAPGIPDSKRTWSEFAGYTTVTRHVGEPTAPSTQETTRSIYFRGMDGDHGSTGVKIPGTTVVDSRQFAGRVYRETVYNGYSATLSTPIVSDTTHVPTSHATGGDGTTSTFVVGDGEVTTTTPTSSGTDRVTRSTTTVDDLGRVMQVADQGDIATGADDVCTQTEYTGADTDYLKNYPSRNRVLSGGCPADINTTVADTAVVSDQRTFYDGSGTYKATTAAGNATRLDAYVPVHHSDGSTANEWQTQSTMTYDALGRERTKTDSRTGTARTTTTDYIPTSGPLTGLQITNPLGWVSSVSYAKQWGTPNGQLDANGHRTDAVLDNLGRVTKVWAADWPASSHASAPSISYAYSLNQNAPSAVATTTRTPAGTLTSYTLFDGLLRPIQTQAPSEGGGSTSVVSDTFYGASGKTTGGHPAWPGAVAPSATLIKNLDQALSIPATKLVYDGAGRQTASIAESTDANGEHELWRTSTFYGGDHTVTTPPAGGTVTATYVDARGHTSKLLQYHGAAGTAADTTTYTYNTRGDLTGMTDPASNDWHWGYDLAGQRISATDPDSGTTTTSYDNAGRLASTTDARGNTLAFTSDDLDRRIAEYDGTTAGAKLASWTFDTLSKGQPTSTTRYDATGQYTVATTGYDAANRPTGQSVSVPSSLGLLLSTYTTSISYFNENGAVSNVHDPAVAGLPVEDIQSGYDSLGQPIALHSSSGFYLGAASYDNLNRPSTMSTVDANGKTTKLLWSWDPITTRLNGLRLSVTGVGDPYNHHYTYNDAGLITADSDTSTGNGSSADTQCYRYDYLQRVTSAWTPASADCSASPTTTSQGGPAPYWTDYAYDLTGNRTSSTTHDSAGTTTDTYTYPAAGAAHPHALSTLAHTGSSETGVTAGSFSYDAAGNTTIDSAGTHYTWDNEDRLADATSSAGSEHRIYDADGNLLVRTSADDTVLYLGDTEVHKAASGGLTGVRTYATGNVTLAERTSKADGTSSFIRLGITGPQNSANASVADGTNAITRRYTDAFGRPRGSSPLWPSDHGFLDKPTDKTTGTTHLGARDYDNDLGRFLSVDSVFDPANPQQDNGYAYASNSPISFSDPSGLAVGCIDYCTATSRSAQTQNVVTTTSGHGVTVYEPDAPPPLCQDDAECKALGQSPAQSNDGQGSIDQKKVMVRFMRPKRCASYTRAPSICGTQSVTEISLYDLLHPKKPKNYCGGWSWACTFVGWNQVRNCIASPNVATCLGAVVAVLGDVMIGGVALHGTVLATALLRAGGEGAGVLAAETAGGASWADASELDQTVDVAGKSLSVLGEVTRAGSTVTVDNIALYGSDGELVNSVGAQAWRPAGAALLRQASGSGVKQVIFRGVRVANSSGKAGHVVNFIGTLGEDGTVTWTLGR